MLMINLPTGIVISFVFAVVVGFLVIGFYINYLKNKFKMDLIFLKNSHKYNILLLKEDIKKEVEQKKHLALKLKLFSKNKKNQFKKKLSLLKQQNIIQS